MSTVPSTKYTCSLRHVSCEVSERRSMFEPQLVACEHTVAKDPFGSYKAAPDILRLTVA